MLHTPDGSGPFSMMGSLNASGTVNTPASVPRTRRVRGSTGTSLATGTDVEAVRDRALRLTRDQRRSFWIAFALAGRIVEEPDGARERARRNLRTMRTSARGGAVVWLDEWERLLDGPVEDLVTALTSRSPRSRELRQSSPFAGLLSADERNRVLDAWSSAEQRKAKG